MKSNTNTFKHSWRYWGIKLEFLNQLDCCCRFINIYFLLYLHSIPTIAIFLFFIIKHFFLSSHVVSSSVKHKQVSTQFFLPPYFSALLNATCISLANNSFLLSTRWFILFDFTRKWRNEGNWKWEIK